jgi:hypothetical protein|tara:strand:- start:201 stop:530 length:330 start_codon:yes stop_codon:yes gene_type:complete
MGHVDRSLDQGGVWEYCTFEVPESVPDERVHSSRYAEKCMHLFGDTLEKQGFTVKAMTRAEEDNRTHQVDNDRRRYIIWAWVTRQPVDIVMDIPDIAVPKMLELGMKLK